VGTTNYTSAINWEFSEFTPAYGLIVTATVARFPPVPFAWTLEENVPLILGQVNFFLEFDVCFFRSQGIFEIHTKS